MQLQAGDRDTADGGSGHGDGGSGTADGGGVEELNFNGLSINDTGSGGGGDDDDDDDDSSTNSRTLSSEPLQSQSISLTARSDTRKRTVVSYLLSLKPTLTLIQNNFLCKPIGEYIVVVVMMMMMVVMVIVMNDND